MARPAFEKIILLYVQTCLQFLFMLTLKAVGLRTRSLYSVLFCYSKQKTKIVLSRSFNMDTNGHLAKDRLVWMDMEMTGLDVQTCHILEVACVVTGPNLNTIAELPTLIIHQPDQVLNSMNGWCMENHHKTGLTEASRNSKLSLQEAESILLQFLKTHTPQGVCPLAGNSVQYDRQFLNRYMPEVDRHLHYRIVDVSTVKELCRRWLPNVYRDAPKKTFTHRALEDIRESIHELRFYRSAMFNCNK